LLKSLCSMYNDINKDTPDCTQFRKKQYSTSSNDKNNTSSSILNTLISGLSIFSVIPAFLGIAYKYSLFGIDRLFQRHYIRNKLKKIKKKMELNI
ncbi:Plasmodium variant antigen protein Cir/Yir/Bir, putative, partial [Plasmodium chabaudi adami]